MSRSFLTRTTPTRKIPKKIILDPSVTTPDKDGNGINLAEWISEQIDQGFISISGGDTHSFNTALASTATLAHSVGAGLSWGITHATTGGRLLFSNTSTLIGGASASNGGAITFGATGININANGTEIIQIGDVTAADNGTIVTISDADTLFQVEASEQKLNAGAGVIYIGDTEAAESNTLITVDDSTAEILLTADNGSSTIAFGDGNGFVLATPGVVTLDTLAGLTLGDTAAAGNGSLISVDDSNSIILLDVDGEDATITLNSSGIEINHDGYIVSVNANTGIDILADGNPVTLTGNTIKFNNVRDESGFLQLNSGIEVETLALAATSDTAMVIPAGAMIIGASFNVDTAVTTSGGDNTWSAALVTGATTTLAAVGRLGALNTKVNTLIEPVITTDVTEVRFTAGNGENFATGVIEVVVYYYTLTSLANA